MSKLPYMQFYFRQFSGDERVMAMDCDTVGAHILLMCAAGASSHGYKLPSDERMLRNIIRKPSDGQWSRIKSQLLQGAWKISADGKWWVQAGLRRTHKKAKEFISEQKRKGKLGADARWKDSHGHEEGMATATQTHGHQMLSSSLKKEQSQNLQAPPVCGKVEKSKPNQEDAARKQIADAQEELQRNPESRGARLAHDEGLGNLRRLLAPVAAKRSML